MAVVAFAPQQCMWGRPSRGLRRPALFALVALILAVLRGFLSAFSPPGFVGLSQLHAVVTGARGCGSSADCLAVTRRVVAELNSMEVAELKVLLKDRGLPVTGKKADLIARLQEEKVDNSSAEGGAEKATSAAEPGAMFKIGEIVESYYEDEDMWYDAKVLKDLGSNSFLIAFTEDNSEQECTPGYIRKNMAKADRDGPIEAGEWVEVYYEEERHWRKGIVQKRNADGTVTVLWDEYGEEYTCKPEVVRKCMPLMPFTKLSVGMKLKGTVKNYREFGMFVDVGAEVQGLLHLSDMTKVKRPKNAPAFDAGERVTALYAEEKEWYPATVDKANDDGTFTITWDDSGEEDGPYTVEARNMKLLKPRFPVKIGRTVDVWVTSLGRSRRGDPEAGRLNLSMYKGGRKNIRKA